VSTGPVAAVREGLFVAGATPHLLGSRCVACGAHHFPAHGTCPYCSSEDVHGVGLSSSGRLWAWTAVTTAPPGYRGEVPYGLGVVELPEGIRVVTRLTEPDPTRLTSGQPMTCVILTLHTEDDGRQITTYAFAADPP